jgi:large subunit ribosomal protein L23
MANIQDILLAPLITEKASEIVEKYNRYGFKVALKANKHQIKNAVETLYNVKVLNVKTSVAPGKPKKSGRNVYKTSKSKMAFVQLEKEQKIEFFKGV